MPLSPPSQLISRRAVLRQTVASLALPLTLASLSGVALTQGAHAQTTTARARPDTAEADRIANDFLKGATPLQSGLTLDLPVLGDNPSAVPVKVAVNEPLSDDLYCEEIIILAEKNPMPLACRLRFGPASGTAEASVRLRLIETMSLRVLARLSDGRVCEARQEITVASGGCGL